MDQRTEAPAAAPRFSIIPASRRAPGPLAVPVVLFAAVLAPPSMAESGEHAAGTPAPGEDAAASRPAGGAQLEALEAAGDAAWDRARPFYEDAFHAWGGLAAGAREEVDAAALERASAARQALALLLRSPGLLEEARKVRTWPPPGAGGLEEVEPRPGRPPAILLGLADEPRAESLERLAVFLREAERRFRRGRGRDRRDELLLLETEALVQRLAGDHHALRGDEAYRRALAAVGAKGENGSGPEEARRAARETRLRWKLRDLEGAREAAGAAGAALADLSAEERAAHLRLLQEIARLQGDAVLVAALENELRGLIAPAEEPLRPGARLPSFLVGASIDLAGAVETLLAVLAHHRLPAREAAVAAHAAGLAAAELGEHSLAEEVLRMPRDEAGADPWLAASIAAQLGAARGELGDYEASLHEFERAGALARGVAGGASLRSRAALGAARALVGLGRLTEARGEALRVLAAADLSPELRVRARLLLGNVLYETGREESRALADARTAFEAAARDLQAARRERPELEDGVYLAGVLDVNTANILREEARLLEGGAAPRAADLEAASARRRRAIEMQDRALRAADAAGERRVAAAAAANLGELYLETGERDAARRFIDWALGWAANKHLFETEWRCRWYLARLADAGGREEEADREYARALAIVESYRGRVLGIEARSGFLTDKLALYQDLVRRELARGDAARALGAAERAKARTLVDSLGWRRLALADPEDARAYREFAGLLAASETGRLRSDAGLFGARAEPPDYHTLRGRLEALQAELHERARKNPALAGLIDGAPARPEEILQALPRDATLLEYFSVGRELVVFVVQDGAVDAVRLEAAPAVLAAQVGNFVRGGAADAEAASRLFTALVAPVVDRVRHGRVIIVPYGVLHGLPFETLREPGEGLPARLARGKQDLRDGRGRLASGGRYARADSRGTAPPPGGKFLLERWEILYASSGSALRLVSARQAPAAAAARLVAVADPDTDYNRDGRPEMAPLAHARREVEAFAPLFGEREVLDGASALERACAARAGQGDVVHFACHGEFYPAQPWDSCLFLAAGPAGSPADDGKLRAAEVLGLDLARARLVTLSGCETGRGAVLAGDDTVGLGTAFLHAGAGALLVSLWRVEDRATSALMTAFYKKWMGERKDKVTALYEAKLELLRGAAPEPRQWGAFILTGEP